MSQNQQINRRFVLANRPQGAPVPANFRLEEKPTPSPQDGEILLRTAWLSLDPYMRIRMNEGFSYAPSVDLGGVMVGESVARVVESRHAGFQKGDLVVSAHGWQDYATSNGTGLIKLPADMKNESLALGTLGMPGFSAYTGLMNIGQPKPGETVAVAAATGAVGSVIGQLAKLSGCRAVGIAGGAKKCAYAVKELGFDACVDHADPAFADLLQKACPRGIDVYFENVGGKIFDTILPLLNLRARVPVCGLIAHYNVADQAGSPSGFNTLLFTLIKRLRIEGFIIYDHYAAGLFDPFFQKMKVLVAEGKVKPHEYVIEGLEHAPQGLAGLLEGKNFGKVVVRVGNA